MILKKTRFAGTSVFVPDSELNRLSKKLQPHGAKIRVEQLETAVKRYTILGRRDDLSDSGHKQQTFGLPWKRLVPVQGN
jgi:hypothetical protein